MNTKHGEQMWMILQMKFIKTSMERNNLFFKVKTMTKEQLIKDGYKLVDTIGEHDIYGIDGSSVYYAMGRDEE